MKQLNSQYAQVKHTREALFNHFLTFAGNDLNKPVPEFNGRSIGGLHTHVANVYLWWVAKIALQKEVVYFDEKAQKNVETLQAHFAVANKYVADFTVQFSGNPETGFDHPDRPGHSYTALEIFTHVITHEFHHKGQLVVMGRLLGYPPPDTDAIRF